MTIRVGANVADQMYVGLQSAITGGTYMGSGALTLKVGATGAGLRKPRAAGTISLGALRIDLIPVQIVRRRGPGDLSVPHEVAGGGNKNGRPFGTGEASLRLVVAGTALRKIDAIDQFDISGEVSTRVVVAGDAIISQRYITGSGELFLGSLVAKDVDNPVLPHVIGDLEGVFADRSLEGLFRDQIELEGVG